MATESRNTGVYVFIGGLLVLGLILGLLLVSNGIPHFQTGPNSFFARNGTTAAEKDGEQGPTAVDDAARAEGQ